MHAAYGVPVTHLFLANMFGLPFCHSMQGLVSLLNSDSICVGKIIILPSTYGATNGGPHRDLCTLL